MAQPEQLRRFMQAMGGNVFLLSSSSFAPKPLVEEVLSEELERQLVQIDGGGGGDVIFSSGDLFDPDSSDSSSFDSCFIPLPIRAAVMVVTEGEMATVVAEEAVVRVAGVAEIRKGIAVLKMMYCLIRRNTVSVTLAKVAVTSGS